ncbi:hypothetical protein [Sphingomonas aerolata]
MADALGLTAVHINRTLQRLTRDSLIARDGKHSFRSIGIVYKI